MNEIERQILKNQATIMCAMRSEGFVNESYLNERANETKTLLNPPEQQSIAEKTHDALCEDSEVKEK